MGLEKLVDKLFDALTVIAALACAIPACYSIWWAFHQYLTGRYNVSLVTVIGTSLMVIVFWSLLFALCYAAIWMMRKFS